MGKLIMLGARRPLVVLLLLALITALAATQLPRVQIDIAAQALAINDEDWVKAQRDLKERFPSDDSLVLFFHDPRLPAPAQLEVVRAAIERVGALPQVKSVISLFSLKNAKSENGEISSRPFFDPFPSDEADASARIADALSNPMLARNLVSEEGDTLLARVVLSSNDRAPAVEAKLVADIDAALAAAESELKQVFQLGPPVVRQAISAGIKHDQVRILSGAVAVLLITLALLLRRWNGAFIPLVTALVSVVWTLAFMASVGISLNVMTSIVPALMVIIGSTEDIHLLAEYYAGLRKGLTKTSALQHMSQRMGTAIFITGLTTYLGFLSIVTNHITILQQFAVAASTGMLFNLLITALFVPAWLSLVDRGQPSGGLLEADKVVDDEGSDEDSDDEGPLQNRAIMVGLGLLFVVALLGASRLEINNDPYAYFTDDSPLIQRVKTMGDELAGVESFAVVLGSDISDTFLKVSYVEEIRKLQDYIDSTRLFDKTLSFADYAGFINRIMEEHDATAELVLPETDDILREYMMFVDPEAVGDYVSKDFSTARIIVRHGISGSRDLSRAIRLIEDYAAEHIDPALRVRLMGDAVSRIKAADAMALGQVQSLGLMVFVIWLIIAVLFVNAKAGLLAVAPNLFPIMILFGVMGSLQIPLDTSTAMIAAISLGICIDDTMHFMVRYHHHTRTCGNQLLAIRRSIRDEAPPIIATSVALALGFAVFALSAFPPVVEFGLLSALVMVTALMALFLILPALLAKVRLITLYDVLALSLRREVLETCELFVGMRPAQIKRVVLLAKVSEFEPGQHVIVEGDEGQDMFVVLDGEVDVLKNGEGGEPVAVAHLGAGRIFGEMALVTGQMRTATVSAATPTKLLVLQWRSVDRLSRLYPRIAARLFRNLSAVLSKRLARM